MENREVDDNVHKAEGKSCMQLFRLLQGIYLSVAGKVRAYGREVFVCVCFFSLRKKFKNKGVLEGSGSHTTPLGTVLLSLTALFVLLLACAACVAQRVWSRDASKVSGGGKMRMGAARFKITRQEKKMKALFTPSLELTFRKPCSAGKFPEGWRKASSMPKNVEGEMRWPSYL